MVSASAGSAAAQTVGDRKWEIEVSGGGTFSMRPARGTALPIEPDAPFTTVVGEPSRRVRSWFFGDGAALLNEAVQGFMYDVPPIDPLDDVLGTGLVGPQAYGGGTSLSVTRVLNRRFAAEVGVNHSTYPRIEVPVETGIRIRESRGSFEPTWSALLPIGPFVEPEVTSADTERDGRLREVAVTGALQVTFPPVGRAVRYASVGGGYVQVSGELPSSGVVGTYRFRICGEHLFEQGRCRHPPVCERRRDTGSARRRRCRFRDGRRVRGLADRSRSVRMRPKGGRETGDAVPTDAPAGARRRRATKTGGMVRSDGLAAGPERVRPAAGGAVAAGTGGVSGVHHV